MVNKDRVVHVRLTTGEEVIGEADSDDLVLYKGNVSLKNPLIIIPEQAGEGRFRIGMHPWVFYFRGKNHEVTIRENAIVFAIFAAEDLVKQYAAQLSPIDLSVGGLGAPGFSLPVDRS